MVMIHSMNSSVCGLNDELNGLSTWSINTVTSDVCCNCQWVFWWQLFLYDAGDPEIGDLVTYEFVPHSTNHYLFS